VKASSCVTKKAQTDGTIPITPTTREARLEKVMEAKESVMNQSRTPTPKIQKVRQHHKDFQKYYEPRVLSLGPIHHDKKPEYKKGEKYKHALTCYYIEDSGKDIEVLYEMIEEKIKELRDCFEEEVTKRYDDNALAWLLFVDGCAILQYIYFATNKLFKDLGINDILVSYGYQDFFLLENQLPYCLLEGLMSLSNKKEELRASIDKFIKMHVMVPEDQQLKKQVKGNQGDSLLPEENPQGEHRLPINGVVIHLLDLLRTSLLGEPNEDSYIIQNRRSNWQSYGNAQELKTAGIHLRRSSNSCLREISFKPRLHLLRNLYLPPINVNNAMRTKLLNLIAYEMCLGFENDFEITFYICFLQSLIGKPEDVKELRKAGVFYNFFGSDKEVAKLFKEMPTDLNSYSDSYIGVEKKIQEYYGTWMSRMSRFYHDNFKGILISLLALVVGVIEVILSRIPTVNPASQRHS
jgi:hypothetical protein